MFVNCPLQGSSSSSYFQITESVSTQVITYIPSEYGNSLVAYASWSWS